MKFIKRKNIDTYKPKSQQISVEVDGRTIINSKKTLTIPVGTNSDRPSSPTVGMIRYNTDIHDIEVYTDYASSKWEKLRTNRASKVQIFNIGTGQGDGTLASIQITTAGDGYQIGDTVNISAPDIGADNAVGKVSTIGPLGQITGVTLNPLVQAGANEGTGYLTVPTVTSITTVGGLGAVLTPVLTGVLEYGLPSIPVDDMGVRSATNIQVYVENVFQLPGINYVLTEPVPGTAYVKFDSPIPFGKPIYAIFGLD